MDSAVVRPDRYALGMKMSDAETVVAWHDALNAGDVERLVALSHEDVEMGGPRGPARGQIVLREWVARSGIRLVLQL